jgi:hypothetical protein
MQYLSPVKSATYSMGNQTTAEVELGWDPGKVLFGLSRIGYTPPSAICDIIDNSVRAEAQSVNVLVRKEREDLSDRRRNNVEKYIITDDGHGMNESGIKNALKLGAGGEEYEEGSLAKFGIGLKSAALSQGRELKVISSDGSSEYKKYVVSLEKIENKGRYFAYEEEIYDEEQNLIDEYVNSDSGTIVKIGKVRKENHPSVRSTVKELKYKVGVIYYYYIKENLDIKIDEEIISPFDILFTDEADNNGKLNENEWRGKSTRWIEKPKNLLLDSENDVSAKIEVTQLPYPPIYGLEESGKDAEIRKKYRIEAGNYGFYVYRNKRLISWSERFGIVPQHGSLYGFRGRILIDESADDAFNIDVKKSEITLSEDAERTLSDYSAEYKSKSRKAWQNAISIRKDREGDDPNSRANQLVDDYTPPESLPGQALPSEDEAQEQNERDAELQEEMKERLREEAAKRKQEEANGEVSSEDVSDEDIEETLKENSNPSAQKIFRVSRIEDNVLWEPYHDADHGTCVRINEFHRFSKLIYDSNYENTDLQIIFELFLLQTAQSEVYAQKNILDHDRNTVKKITKEHRRVISEFLADMCRKIDEELPKSEDHNK